MSSEAKIRANRHNARRSTGPRSEGGKARSARNARRHGVFDKCAIGAAAKDVRDEVLRPSLVGVFSIPSDTASLDRAADAQARLFASKRALALAHTRIDDLIALMEDMPEAEGTLDGALEQLLREVDLLMRYRAEAAAQRRKAIRHILQSEVSG